MKHVINCFRRYYLSAPLGLALGWGLAALYASITSASWLTYQNQPFEVLTPVVRAGQSPIHRIARCNSSGVRQVYNTTHTLTPMAGGDDLLLPDVKIEIEPGCFRVATGVNPVPLNAALGFYLPHGTAITESLWGKKYVVWYGEPFEVIAKEKP